MNDELFIAEFSVIAKAHTPFAGWTIRERHDDETTAGTVLILSSVTTPLLCSAVVGRATLSAIVRSDSADQTPAQHQARVAAVLTWLTGSTLVTALAVRAKVALLGRVCPLAPEPGLDASSFETVLTAAIGWRAI